MKEIWKDIEGYEGRYQVSNEGNVRSLAHDTVIHRGKEVYTLHKPGLRLKPTTLNHGYLGVCLYHPQKHSGHKRMSIHRLVAQAFLPNPDGYAEVNHIDENKANNRAENLEWCTRSQNMRSGTLPRRIGDRHKNGRRSKKIAQYTKDGNLVRVYPSLNEAKRQGYQASNICKCAQGHRSYSHAYGYVWRYVDGDA